MIERCIKRSDILELQDIIHHLNSINNECERETYLQEVVEDVDLFLTTLRGINKSKLATSKKKKSVYVKSQNYSSEVVIKIFEENDLEEIVAKYTKKN